MGKIIVIEGTDSSGKETQTKLLYERVKKIYDKTIKISFPNYDSPACEPVKMYLAGAFGTDATKVNPYPISTMYAIDRYASFKQDWEKKYIDDYIIITDRYVTSNMIHQASKIEDIKEKDEYLRWLIDLEYNKNEIPEPDIVIFLKMPIDKVKELMENRKNKIDGSEKRDIHEVNEDYLKKSYENATAISKKYNWCEIECVENNKIKSIERINDEIFSKIKEIIRRAKELNMTSLAITDHGVMYGVIDFYKEAKANGIKPMPVLNGVLGSVINLIRSVPFMILLIMVIPLTRLMVGTSIGPVAVIPPLVIAAAPYIARMVESSLKEVDAGVIEAAKSMGASNMQIIFKVLLPESKPSLLVGAAISVTTILGYSAMAGFTGGGGLGTIAINYGYYRYQTDIMFITVAILVILVQIIQEIFMRSSKHSDKRVR